MSMKFITLYQIYDSNGNKRYEPFHVKRSARYMIEYSRLENAVIVELEIELINKTIKIEV